MTSGRAPRAPGLDVRDWSRWALLALAVATAVTVLVITAAAPRLSPDSVTYLAAAESIRDHARIAEFTGDPLTIFPPVFPLLLAPGGASLGWARVVLSVAFAAAVWLIGDLVRRRSGRVAGMVAALATATSVGLIAVATTVWSEMPYIAISLGALGALAEASRRGSARWLVLCGSLAGLGFLTRYAGAGLVVAVAAGAAMSVPRHGGARRRLVAVGTVLAAAAAPVAVWVTRNLIVSGQALGSRFEGGSPESWTQLWQRAAHGVSRAIRPEQQGDLLGNLAAALFVVTAVTAAVRWWRGARPVTDLAIAAFGLGGFAVPILARKMTSNDIESRVMSPVVPAVVAIAAIAAAAIARRAIGTVAARRARWALRWTAIVAAAAVLVAWSAPARRYAEHYDLALDAALNRRAQFDEQLYDALFALPADALITTNNPHRVWWFGRRAPTLVAFTRGRPGGSMFPVPTERLVALICQRPTYLGFFLERPDPADTPRSRRPDQAAVIDLEPLLVTPRGGVYRLTVPEARCPPQR